MLLLEILPPLTRKTGRKDYVAFTSKSADSLQASGALSFNSVKITNAHSFGSMAHLGYQLFFTAKIQQAGCLECFFDSV